MFDDIFVKIRPWLPWAPERVRQQHLHKAPLRVVVAFLKEKEHREISVQFRAAPAV